MSHVAWSDAWMRANTEFYENNRPEGHFATSVELADQIARALAELIVQERDRHHDREFVVIDVGSGSGRLLEQLRPRLASDVHLLGIDMRERPPHLPIDFQWRQVILSEDSDDVTGIGTDVAGVLIAHEFLDDIPCDVVEFDDDLSPHLVLVDPQTGAEELGPRLDDPAAATLLEAHRPSEIQAWIDTWWPATRAGGRREVGLARQRLWSTLIRSVRTGCAVAIDYAHTRADRAAGIWDAGTLKGFSSGRPRRPVPDGSVNITAHVALDSLASPSARLISQAEILGTSSLSSWPAGLGSYTWLIEPLGKAIDDCRT